MKITEYNQQGAILFKKECQSTIPEHIKTFCGNHPLIRLSHEEVESLSSRPRSLKEHLLLDKAEFLFQQDFTNYIKSGLFSPEVLFCRDGGIELDGYDEITEAVSICISKYNRLFNPHGVIANPTEQTTLQEDIIRVLSNKNWIEGLLCRAIINSSRNYKEENRHIAIAKSLASIIHKYYYVLISQPNLNSTLRAQIAILKPFANLRTSEFYTNSILNSDSFVINCIKSLQAIPDSHRSELYKLLSTFSYLTTGIVGFAIKRNTSSTTITLSAPTTSYNVSMTDDDYATLLSVDDDEKEMWKELQVIFVKIYNDYLLYKEDNWEKTLLNRVWLDETIQNKESESICSYLYLQELKDIDRNCKAQVDKYQPQICFHDILFQYTNFMRPQKLCFTHDIVVSVICTLRHNGCSNQEGLYEKMFTLNYLLENSDIEVVKCMRKLKLDREKTKAVEVSPHINKALDFLEDIMSQDYINTDVLSVKETRALFTRILYKKEFLNQIGKERPRIRKQEPMGFNRGLIYNIIGVLRDLGVHKDISPKPLFRGSASDIDKALMSDFANANHAKFISQYTPCERSVFKSSFQIPDGLEKIILEEFTKIRSSHKP